jgi:hypothetical protein
MSRLAGAGGAAESALMNAQAHYDRPEAGGVEGGELRVHVVKFTGKLVCAQTLLLLAKRYVLPGLVQYSSFQCLDVLRGQRQLFVSRASHARPAIVCCQQSAEGAT